MRFYISVRERYILIKDDERGSEKYDTCSLSASSDKDAARARKGDKCPYTEASEHQRKDAGNDNGISSV